MKVIGVIPARYKATRFAGKVLADLLGKPVIQHVWERAKESTSLDDVVIACDDERILTKAKEFGANVVLTSKNHTCGSDRIAEAIKDLNCDIVINIQGDEPLIHHSIIDDLAKVLRDDNTCMVATVIKAIENQDELSNPNVVKVVIDKDQFALYFSRSPIPYNRTKMAAKDIEHYKHLGLYGYRKEFLMRFKDLPVSQLEQTEQLEQLRILQAGYKIKTVKTERITIGVDTKEDLLMVEEVLKKEISVG